MEIKKRGATYIEKAQMIIGADRTENKGQEPRAGQSEREKMKNRRVGEI